MMDDPDWEITHEAAMAAAAVLKDAQPNSQLIAAVIKALEDAVTIKVTRR